MERCKTCKHWKPENPQEQGSLLGGGECKKAPQVWDVADRVEATDEWTTNYQLRPEHAAVLAVVEDGSAYYARLVTMADFGCVQHEQA